MYMKHSLWIGALAAVALFGAGCSSSTTPEQTKSPAEMAQTIQLHTGDQFDVRQTVYNFGDIPSKLWKGTEASRVVTLTSYDPRVAASLEWKSELTQETASSVKARADYEASIAKRKEGADYPPPPPVIMEELEVRGMVPNIDLRDTQTLLLPTYWLPGETNALNQKSAVWLSQNAYLELSRNGSTDVYMDVGGSNAQQLLRATKEWSDLAKQLKTAEQTAQKQEPTRLVAESERVTVPLTVNGQTVNVSAIRAKNAYGELTILDNRDNPLILKADIHPSLPGIAEAAGIGDWEKLFGYEVSSLTLREWQGM